MFKLVNEKGCAKIWINNTMRKYELYNFRDKQIIYHYCPKNK